MELTRGPHFRVRLVQLNSLLFKLTLPSEGGFVECFRSTSISMQITSILWSVGITCLKIDWA